MQVLLAIIFGAAVGIVVHLTLPHPQVRGVVLAPMIGAVVGGVTWTVMTWLGITISNPWIWVLSVLAPLVLTYPIVGALTRVRATRDERAIDQLVAI